MVDGQGRTVDFRNSVIIMTSNLGSQYISENIKDEKLLEENIMEVVKSSFRPEFLNRIDEIIIYKPLTVDHIKEIVNIQINFLRKRLEDKKMDIELSEKAKEALAEQGYDPVYGARPLKRTIQRLIQNPLATELLKGEYKEGDLILVDVDKNNEFTFNKKQNRKAA
jgi:ATP-dependent Clp protease ATP-binding subunit ClpB